MTEEWFGMEGKKAQLHSGLILLEAGMPDTGLYVRKWDFPW